MNRELSAIEITIGIVVLLLIAFIGYGLLSHHDLYPRATATSTPRQTLSGTISPTILPLGSPPASVTVSPKPTTTPISGCFTTGAGMRICANSTK